MYTHQCNPFKSLHAGNDRLLLIVPYRDRAAHLKEFRKCVYQYFLSDKVDKFLNVKVVIVEQLDKLPFNRGALLNVGVEHFCKSDISHLCFHDVDCFPIQGDYRYSPKVTLLKPNSVNGMLFSSVVICPVRLFKTVNGFSCGYWDWGSEDTDFYMRAGNDLEIRDWLIFGEGHHPHSSLENGITKPACLQNHARLLRQDFSVPQIEGLSTVTSLSVVEIESSKCFNIEFYHVGVDLNEILQI